MTEPNEETIDVADDLAAVLSDIVHFLRRYVAFSSAHQSIAIALWTVHTHRPDAAEASPYLSVTSAEKRSGKSRLLDVLELLVHSPWRAITPTEAVLFRMLTSGEPTLMLDEVDAIFGKRTSERYEGVRAILNAGNRRGTTVPRVVGEGTKMRVEHFSVYGPKVIAGIGALPDTIADRSIPIRLRRRGSDEQVDRFRLRDVKDEGARLRARIVAVAAQLDLVDARPHLPAVLNDRAADGWEPLLAIADAAGPNWHDQAARAACAISADVESEEESLGIRLLRDIRDAFDSDGSQRLPTIELLDRLTSVDAAPWAEFREGRPLTPPQLARTLRPYGIGVTTYRTDARTVKGYRREDFKDAWDRYAPSVEEPVNGNAVTQDSQETDSTHEPTSLSPGSYRVTDWEAPGEAYWAASPALLGHSATRRE